MALYSRMPISMSASQDCDVTILRRFIVFMHPSFNCAMWGNTCQLWGPHQSQKFKSVHFQNQVVVWIYLWLKNLSSGLIELHHYSFWFGKCESILTCPFRYLADASLHNSLEPTNIMMRVANLDNSSSRICLIVLSFQLFISFTEQKKRRYHSVWL